MKGDTYGRRFVDFKQVGKQFLADQHAADESNHAMHLRLVLAASKRGFTWLVRGNA